jgi:hypothetical protein
MDESDMRQVDQILDQQQVIRLDMKIGADRGPVRIVIVREIGNLRRIGFVLLAHPDPDIAMALDHRIAAHRDARRHTILARNGDAGAGRIEGEAVIAAL